MLTMKQLKTEIDAGNERMEEVLHRIGNLEKIVDNMQPKLEEHDKKFEGLKGWMKKTNSRFVDVVKTVPKVRFRNPLYTKTPS